MVYKEEFISYLRFEKRYSPHTLQSYQNDLNQFHAFSISIGEEGTEPDPVSIRLWMVSLLENKVTPRSVHRKISALRTYCRYLIREGILKSNPVDRVIKPKMKKRLPSFVEEKSLNKFLNEYEFGSHYEGFRNRMIIEILYQTGIRRNELVQMQTGSIDFYRRELKVLGKRNKERIIPLGRELCNDLREYIHLLESSFPGAEGSWMFRTPGGRQIYPRLVHRIIHQFLSEVTSLEKKSPHLLRHSFATHLLNKGADLNAIKELLGHAGLAATQVYTHNSFEKLKEVYNKAHPQSRLRKEDNMNTKIHSIHFDADQKLIDFIDSRLQKLLLFYEDILNAEVYLRLEDVDDNENKVAEIRLEIPGKSVFAKKKSKTFEEATDNVIEAIRRQLQKQKGKLKQA